MDKVLDHTPLLANSKSRKHDGIASKHIQNRQKSLFDDIWYKLANMILYILPVCLAFVALIWLVPQATRIPARTTIAYPDLLEAGAEVLVSGLETRRWNSLELTKAYIRRIEEVNPILRAVTEINPDALGIAASLDIERAEGHIRSPLHGLPMLLKDNIATNDGMNNTAGSFSLLGAAVSRDSTVAAKLRVAGVIILGKANMSQWAYFRSRNSSSGWSAYGGQVTGAYYPNMNPSGSSSGSGVATSIGLAFASLGTETSGSIVSPASNNNLVGIKPTVGLTSRSLVIPISEHQDTIGPMTRSVYDAAAILSIIAGKDVRDNYTLAQPFSSPPDYTKALNVSSLNGARIGIVRNAIGEKEVFNLPVHDAFEVAIATIKRAGATVIDNANYNSQEEWRADQQRVLLTVLESDILSGLPKYLSELSHNPNNITSLADVSNFTHHFPAEDWPERDTRIWDDALKGTENTDYKFWQAYQKGLRWSGPDGILGALAKDNLDALILPTNWSAAMPAYAGFPIVSVPMGFYPPDSPVKKTVLWDLAEVAPNIPFGLSFVGAKWSEETLISYAYAYEQATQTRTKVKPLIVPKTQLKDIIGKY
ncbi:glutamyl-tRNA amidotransferase subunit A [Amylocarpus encephaloides]|uniref:Glutamyl-tRNA amidotransferase subunit A n=1 Tax=Amylocarpus encephaloides TaxID=45428 RepID=A0A9P7Y6X3_9HELO|nr:glutamyl-tRNA amidotransferase subunit A [Amylocarpus encephaloides]